jgi:hypothetical protein
MTNIIRKLTHMPKVLSFFIFFFILNFSKAQYNKAYLYEDCEICSCSKCGGNGIITKKDWIVCSNCVNWSSEYRRKKGCDVCYDNKGWYSNPYDVTCSICSGQGKLINTRIEEKRKEKREKEQEANRILSICESNFQEYIKELKAVDLIQDLQSDALKSRYNTTEVYLYKYGKTTLSYKDLNLRVKIKVLDREIEDINYYYSDARQDYFCYTNLKIKAKLILSNDEENKSGEVIINYKITNVGDEVKREFIDINNELTEEERNETELLLEEKHQKEITDNFEKIDNEIKEGRLRFNFVEDNPERISKIKSIIDFNVNRKKTCYIISYKSVDLENTIPISTSPFSGNFRYWGYGEINKVKIIFFKNKNENEDKIIKEITFYGSNGGRYSIDTIEYDLSSFYKNLINELTEVFEN